MKNLFYTSRIFAILTLALSILSGCTVTLNLPAVRFDSPEAQGHVGKGYIGAGLSGGNDLRIIPDTTAAAPTDRRTFSGAGNFPIIGGVGLLDRLDMDLRLQGALTGSSIPLAKVKYQFLGEPRAEATFDNFSLSATVAGGAVSHTQTDNGVGFSSVVATTDEHFWEWDAALIAGYRPVEFLVVYGGPFFTHAGFHGSIVQTGTGAASPFAYAGTVDQSGMNVGALGEYKHLQAKVEIAYAYAASANASTSGLSVGTMISFIW